MKGIATRNSRTPIPGTITVITAQAITTATATTAIAIPAATVRRPRTTMSETVRGLLRSPAIAVA
jgi:hypothetical protein